MDYKKGLLKSAKKIKRDIFLFPFLILLLSIIPTTFISYHEINEFKKKELNELKKQLLNNEKNRHQEIQLLEKFKLAQMGEMIGNIAHQWRQPLTTISLITSSLKLQIELNLKTNQKDMVKDFDLILNLTQYLSNTIEQFKEFIKTDRNIKEEVVQEIISSLTKIVGSSLKYYNIELINEIKNKNSIC